MKKQLLSALLLTCITGVMAQIPDATTSGERPLSVRLQERQVNNQIQLSKVLEARKLPARITSERGLVQEAMYVTPTGHIVYNKTYNVGAGRTLSTNKVWPGGGIGVSLTGQNMPNRLGIWDGGAVRTTHQEFGGRVTQTDAAPTLNDHATHVAGTMIASGVTADAKGMAYQASLKAYDWNNDDVEMEQAAAAGMLISNHSYGSISGWNYSTSNARWEWYGDPSVSTTEDYKFGQYDASAQGWDEIAVNYPYYLICKAAGNDRGDNKSGSTWYYSDGSLGSGTAPAADGGTSGFDCIPTYGNAKNILTVGAVNKIGGNTGNGWTQTSDVVMSSFSGWGPTDDGRIKPDVVSPGVSIYSSISTSNTDYDTYNGTSMATPAASGSLLLVQQHFFNLKAKYMRSATLKALVIHTADEAGNLGPDYKYGWGLMNTASCVKLISDSSINKIDERTLTNGQSQSLQFSADAGKPLKITICWTDKAGTPVSSSLLDNTTKMLVNDLDIRLTRNSDNTLYNPYILDPANPNNAATTGDNTRDNVEMIYVGSPQAGTYTLTISHKGTLVGSTQPFSLIISNGTEKTLAQFSVNKTIICPGQSVVFTDASTGAVSQRTWYFPGGNPATSTAVSPTVTYPTAGIYPVALKVTGSLGTDSVYKTKLITVGGLTLPFNETFESNSPTLSSWLLSNPDAATTWTLTTTSGTTPGTTSASIKCFDYSSTGQRDGIITPALNFQTHTNISVSFQHAYTRYGGQSAVDSLIVYASTNCGTSWIRVQGFGENGSGNFATYQNGYTYGSQSSFVPAGASDWCGGGTGSSCKTINLNQFVGQPSVMLMFECYNNYGNNLYIDNVNINGTPLKPVAAFDATQTTVCVGQSVTMMDKTSNVPSAWNWTFAGASPAVSSDQNPTIVYNAPGTYSIKLKASNTGGTDSITKTNYITVVNPPLAPNIKAGGPVQFCVGDSVLLSSDSSGSLNWYANDVLIAQNVQQIYAKQNATYRVARSNGFCEASSSLTVNATVKPSAPTVTSSIPGSAFCQGGSVTLTSSAASGNQWYKNGNLIGGATNTTYQLNDSGSYTVVYTTLGCPSNASTPKAFSMLARPIVDPISGNSNPVRGQATTYSVTAVSGNTYTWTIVNGTILSGNGSATVSARFNTVDSGSITVTGRSAIGCLSVPVTKKLMVSPADGTDEYSQIRNLSLYPIPAKTFISIRLEGVEAHQADIRVINMLGQVVTSQHIAVTSGAQSHNIDLSNLNKGMYMIEIQGNKGKTARRIIVE